MCEAFARRDWSSALAPLDPDIEWAGDEVLVLVRDRGRGKGSGALVERSWAQLWTVRVGEVVRFRPYADREAALAMVAS
jgi:hypothetical protein